MVMARLKKGSAAAKAYMRKIRGMRKGGHVSRVSHKKNGGGKTRMVRRSYRRFSRKGHSGKSLMRSMEKLSKIAAASAPILMGVGESGLTIRGAQNSIKYATGFTPWSGNFAIGDLIKGWTPLVATTVAWAVYHKANGLIRGL